MYLLRIAFRNLFRRKKRTFIIACILVLTAVFFLCLESFVLALFGSAFDNAIDVRTPHIEIARKNFVIASENKNQDLPLEEAFIPSEDLLKDIRTPSSFSYLTPVIDFSADFIAGRDEYQALARSIDVESFGEVFKTASFLKKGEFIDENSTGIVIGDQLAEFFDLEVGDFFTLRFRDIRGSFNTIEGEVQGILSTPDPQINSRMVFLSRNYAVERLGLARDKVSQLMIRLEDKGLVSEQSDILNKKVSDNNLRIRSYQEIEEFIVSARTWNMLQTYFLLACFLLVGIIGIICAIILAVIERIEEIGMMKAMGLRQSEIVRVFILEAGGIGIIGGLLGSIIGTVIILLFKRYGLSAELIGMSDLGLFALEGSKIYGALNISSIIMIFFILVIFSLAASIIPAYWGASKDPVDAIHHK